jgi:hypothetical protein
VANETLILVPPTPVYWQWFESVFWIILAVIILYIVYLIIKEIRQMKNIPRLAEIDLEKEKLNLMKLEMATRGQPFYRVNPEQIGEIKKLADENVSLETDIFAKHNVVDKRIERLENKVKLTKLDHMVEKIKDEERKIG